MREKLELPTLPLFPVTYIDEEGSSDSYESIEELESDVEFVHDYDPEYRCFDTTGRRVRLIVWNLQLLILQVVPEEFERSGLRVASEITNVGMRRFELYGNLLLRSVTDEVGEVTASPASWDGALIPPARFDTTTTEELHIVKFNNDWMYKRTADRFWLET